LAETAFLYRATEEGLELSKPYALNCRYDAIADNGQDRHLVQVKSTTCSYSKDKFRVRTTRSQYQKGRRGGREVRYEPSEVDFIAVYLIPEKSFYIIPLAALQGKTRVTLYSSKHRKKGPFAEYLEAWHLFWPTNLDPVKIRLAQMERAVSASLPKPPIAAS
jgi:hypothetical protein